MSYPHAHSLRRASAIRRAASIWRRDWLVISTAGTEEWVEIPPITLLGVWRWRVAERRSGLPPSKIVHVHDWGGPRSCCDRPSLESLLAGTEFEHWLTEWLTPHPFQAVHPEAIGGACRCGAGPFAAVHQQEDAPGD